MKHKRPEPDPLRLEAVLLEAANHLAYGDVRALWAEATVDNYRHAPAEIIVALLIERYLHFRNLLTEERVSRKVAEGAVRDFTEAARRVLTVLPTQDVLFEEVTA